MKRIGLIALGLVIVLLWLPVGSAFPLSWTKTTIFATGTAGNAITINRVFSTDTVISAFEVSGTGIVFSKSTNRGASWEAGITAVSGTVGQPDIEAASTATFVIAYLDAIGLDLKVAISTNGGATWASSTVDSTGDSGTRPSLEIYNANIWAISHFETASLDVRVCYTTNAGTSWTCVAVDTALINSIGKLEIVSATNWLVAYSRGAAGSADMYLAYTTDGGGTWTPVDVPETTAAHNGLPGGILAKDGNTYIVATTVNQVTAVKQLRLHRTDDNGGTWSEIIVASSSGSGGVNAFTPLILEFSPADGDDAIIGMYQQATQPSATEYFGLSTAFGGAWTFVTDIVTGGAQTPSSWAETLVSFATDSYLMAIGDLTDSNAFVYRSSTFVSGTGTVTASNPLNNMITYVGDSWGFDAHWLFGIIAVGIVTAGFAKISTNITILSIAVLLGIGLSVLMGLFPVWVLFLVVLLIIALVVVVFGRGRGEEGSE